MSRADPRASGCLPLCLFRENKECSVNTHRPPPRHPRFADIGWQRWRFGEGARITAGCPPGELAQLGQARTGRFLHLAAPTLRFWAFPKLKGKVAGSQIESNGLILQFYSRSGGPDWRSREATWCRDRMPGGHAAARWAKDSRWRGRDGRKSGFIQAIMNMSLNLFFF